MKKFQYVIKDNMHDQIRQMTKGADGDVFENLRSLNQELTFQYAAVREALLMPWYIVIIIIVEYFTRNQEAIYLY